MRNELRSATRADKGIAQSLKESSWAAPCGDLVRAGVFLLERALEPIKNSFAIAYSTSSRCSTCTSGWNG